MDNEQYNELWNLLKFHNFPARLARGSKERKNWSYHARHKYKIQPQFLNTATIERLMVASESKNILGWIIGTYLIL